MRSPRAPTGRVPAATAQANEVARNPRRLMVDKSQRFYPPGQSSDGLDLRRDRQTDDRPRPGCDPPGRPVDRTRPDARTRSENDRRIVEVSITKKGLDLLKELDPHSLQMPRALMGYVSASKLRQLTTLLAEVLDGMGTYP